MGRRRPPKPSKRAIREEMNIYAQDKKVIDKFYEEDKGKEKKKGS